MKQHHFLSGLLIAISLLFLGGCAFNSQPAAIQYDLGPTTSMPAERIFSSNMPPIIVSQVDAPAWLNNNKMYYRLSQVNDQQTRFYTRTLWNMPPAKLFREYLKSLIVSSSGEIGGQKISTTNALRLFIYIEDFSQYFYSDESSEGRIALRASLLGKDNLLIQKSFYRAIPAPTPDAAGGVKALATGANEIMTEILYWVKENYKKESS